MNILNFLLGKDDIPSPPPYDFKQGDFYKVISNNSFIGKTGYVVDTFLSIENPDHCLVLLDFGDGVKSKMYDYMLIPSSKNEYNEVKYEINILLFSNRHFTYYVYSEKDASKKIKDIGLNGFERKNEYNIIEYFHPLSIKSISYRKLKKGDIDSHKRLVKLLN